ncbi:MAG: NAD(P)-dependent oxidoreductase [Chloroflexi bacterium]|nr:NAD(P)-dependent oxidoreductase [Chloroflexota bacterium]
MTHIGFIGLGIMGSRMAANLIDAGHTLTVHNRTAGKAAPLLEHGAQWAETPAGVAQGAEIVFTMLAHPQAVEGMLGFLPALPDNTLWVDCSTTNPSFARRMAAEASANGHRFIDAPVAGSKKQAAAGELVFICGGAQADIDEARPLFEAMGSRVAHVGEAGMGVSMKVVVNFLLASSMAAFAEGVALGQALGIPREALLRTIIGGPVAAPYLSGKQPKFESGDYSAEFPLKWMHKDLHMVAETAYEAGVPMPAAALTEQLFRAALQAGLGDEDFSAYFKHVTG